MADQQSTSMCIVSLLFGASTSHISVRSKGLVTVLILNSSTIDFIYPAAYRAGSESESGTM